MAKSKKKRVRRGPRRTVARHTSTVRRRRRKTGLSASGQEIMAHAKGTGSGAAGGVLYSLPMAYLKPNLLLRGTIGIAGAMILSFMNAPFMGAGVAGATAHDVTTNLLSKAGLADGMEDVEYVDPRTLSDSGYMDDDGNAIVMDDDGVMYALNDMGEYEAIGDAYSLQDELEDPYSLQDVEGVQMIPAYL